MSFIIGLNIFLCFQGVKHLIPSYWSNTKYKTVIPICAIINTEDIKERKYSAAVPHLKLVFFSKISHTYTSISCKYIGRENIVVVRANIRLNTFPESFTLLSLEFCTSLSDFINTNTEKKSNTARNPTTVKYDPTLILEENNSY